MKAFVIGEDQIRKAAYAAFAVVILAFVSGYYLGSGKMLSALPVKSNLPAVVAEKVEATEVAPLIKSTEKTAKAELKKTQKSDAKKSEHKKVDKKKKEKPQKTSKKLAETKKSQNNKTVKSKQVKKTTEVKKSKQPEKIAKKKEIQKDKAGVNKLNKSKPVTGSVEKKKTKNEKQSPSAGLVNKQVQAVNEGQGNMTSEGRVYSIQAGMFASEANARSFIEKLAEKKFDAYVSDFVSTSGAIKYNVRVGRFEQRDQARVLLRDFQKSFSSPAYVVITE